MAEVDQMYDEALKMKDQGDIKGAIEKLKSIVAIDPKHVLSHSALAVHLQKAGKEHYAEAIEHAKKVVELEPDDSFSYTQLSVICQRCGLIPEAEDAMARSRMMQSGH
jgi:Flp pilus assembly protein TadD